MAPLHEIAPLHVCSMDMIYPVQGATNGAPTLFQWILVNDHAKYRDDSKKDNKKDGNIKNQFFNTASSFKDRTRARAAERTAQSGAACLQQNEDNRGDGKYNLYHANGWNPLSQDIFLTFVFDCRVCRIDF